MAGQTLAQIRSLLAVAGLAPRKQFGQHFLIDLNLMRKLAASAEPAADDVLLEVGPGTGSLTEMLVESGARVVAVEVDHGLCELLRGRFSSAPRLTLIEGDALAAKHRLNAQVVAALASLQPGAAGARKLVANLPYQIATPLLINLLYAEPPLERLCCTIQREVGDRLTAAAGSDAYGPVSVLVQGMARVRRIAHVPPEAFWPRPEVESIMLRITPEPAPDVSAAEAEGLSRLVHRGFAQRRKKLRTSIRDAGLPSTSVDAALEAAGISRDARPEALSPAEWLTFHRALARFRPAAAGGATPRS